MTPSRNTRSYKLRSVPSSPGQSFFSFIKWQNNPKYDNLSRNFYIFLTAWGERGGGGSTQAVSLAAFSQFFYDFPYERGNCLEMLLHLKSLSLHFPFLIDPKHLFPTKCRSDGSLCLEWRREAGQEKVPLIDQDLADSHQEGHCTRSQEKRYTRTGGKYVFQCVK